MVGGSVNFVVLLVVKQYAVACQENVGVVADGSFQSSPSYHGCIACKRLLMRVTIGSRATHLMYMLCVTTETRRLEVDEEVQARDRNV